MKTLPTFLVLFFCATTVLLQAQREKLKFGKVSLEEFTVPAEWADYEAVVLYDRGFSSVAYNSGRKAFAVHFNRHLRILINKEAGLDWANFTIPLYHHDREEEAVTDFEAYSFTNINGEITEEKVNQKALFFEKINEYYKAAKIGIPKVSVGSIIDIEYEVSSPFVANLRDWEFQYSIPAEYSSYEVAIPEWFNYNFNFEGYELQRIVDMGQSKDRDGFNYNGGGVQSYQRNKRGWYAEKMPPLADERFITNIDNYLVKVDFELSEVWLPNQPLKVYSDTWKGVNDKLMDSEYFGRQVHPISSRFLKEIVEEALVDATTEEEKIAALYKEVKRRIAWNGYYGKYTSGSLKSVLKEGVGNVGDVNLLLVAIFQAADIEAVPIILSTRDHGLINPKIARGADCNYVIAGIRKPEGGFYFFDATERTQPPGILPSRCLNGMGLAIVKDGPVWISILPETDFWQARSLKLTFDDDLTLKGAYTLINKGYAAIEKDELAAENFENSNYVKNMAGKIEGSTIHSAELDSELKIDNPQITEHYEISLENQVIDGGETIYFNPLLFSALTENIFKADERNYPVDFNYPVSTLYSARIALPEGYTVEALPEPLSLQIEDGTIVFNYSVKQMGENLVVFNKLDLKKHVYPPEEYKSMKELYGRMVEKQSEMVVLKKK